MPKLPKPPPVIARLLRREKQGKPLSIAQQAALDGWRAKHAPKRRRGPRPPRGAPPRQRPPARTGTEPPPPGHRRRRLPRALPPGMLPGRMFPQRSVISQQVHGHLPLFAIGEDDDE